MTKRHWKALLGARLKEMRERSHGGKGMTHEKAAQTIKRTEAYVVRLETKMESENPTVNILDDLATLYGGSIGDLFDPVVTKKDERDYRELISKLQFILKDGPGKIASAITENIEGMYDRARKLRKEGG